MNRPTILDLFCGGGGLSLGAHLAGFATTAAVDVDATLSSAMRENFRDVRLVNADLAKLAPSNLKRELDLVRPDGIIGGPPCQGFSAIGRRESNDPRNLLLFHFFRYVRFFKPSFFLMENVPGLFEERNKSLLNDALSMVPARYKLLRPMILNAADFGAATKRKRLVLIGIDPEYSADLSESEIDGAKVDFKTTVRDSIADLPSLKRQPLEGEWMPYPKKSSLSAYAKMMKQAPKNGMGTALARRRRREGFVSGCQTTLHTEEVIDRFSSMAQGDRDPISKYPKLKWNEPASVLRAGTGAERGSYQAARPIHPQQPRVISVREAARIQGFPDWYQFHSTKWHSHRMIGNSVSPIFAKSLLEVIASKIAARDDLRTAK